MVYRTRKTGKAGTTGVHLPHKYRHTPPLLPRLLDDPLRPSRFWGLVSKGGPKECWPWTGYTDRDGYGAWKIGEHKRVRANRIAYILTFNCEIGDALVCHSCDNPRCCNPDHLWLGTPALNYQDMVKKGRATPPYGRDDLTRR